MSDLKMYILVRDDVPLGPAIVAVAHASLAGYLKFADTPEVKAWLSMPFRKVVCMANAKEFENSKSLEDHLVMTESALEKREVAIVFKPRAEWPRMFKFLRLYQHAPAFSSSS
jgi:peptidyl-tRNA hydrolase